LLPQALQDRLAGLPQLDLAALNALHASGEQVTSIRRNLFKQPQAYSFSFDKPVPWCAHAAYLQERPFFTFDPLLHAGAYYVQDASSMCIWTALTQVVKETKGLKVLDLCAAPGGKTTLLADYFHDGIVVANEVIRSRAAILVENITKWGAGHVIVTNNDPADFTTLHNYFDVMLVDAPCSGSGLFRKDPDAVNEWSPEHVQLCSQRQQRILADALPALKPGGILVYATCSYSPEEDETIMDWLMAQSNVESVVLDLPGEWNIVPTQSASGATGYRFYPHLLKGEGFFLAVFRKAAAAHHATHRPQQVQQASKQEQQLLKQLIPELDNQHIIRSGEIFKAVTQEVLDTLGEIGKLYIRKAGIAVGQFKGKDLIPDHELALWNRPIHSFAAVELDETTALQYLRRKDISLEGSRGWNLICYKGLALGWAKVLPNRVNNYYPQGYRILKD
jgi:NOL1/NOP2/sun family putative RNA methylase